MRSARFLQTPPSRSEHYDRRRRIALAGGFFGRASKRWHLVRGLPGTVPDGGLCRPAARGHPEDRAGSGVASRHRLRLVLRLVFWFGRPARASAVALAAGGTDAGGLERAPESSGTSAQDEPSPIPLTLQASIRSRLGRRFSPSEVLKARPARLNPMLCHCTAEPKLARLSARVTGLPSSSSSGRDDYQALEDHQRRFRTCGTWRPRGLDERPCWPAAGEARAEVWPASRIIPNDHRSGRGELFSPRPGPGLGSYLAEPNLRAMRRYCCARAALPHELAGVVSCERSASACARSAGRTIGRLPSVLAESLTSSATRQRGCSVGLSATRALGRLRARAPRAIAPLFTPSPLPTRVTAARSAAGHRSDRFAARAISGRASAVARPGADEARWLRLLPRPPRSQSPPLLWRCPAGRAHHHPLRSRRFRQVADGGASRNGPRQI